MQTAGKAMRDLLIPAYVKAFHSVNGEWSTAFSIVSAIVY